jgi:predicted RNA-binding Zn-ribbon protein involved in translation (DUF1610 family)
MYCRFCGEEMIGNSCPNCGTSTAARPKKSLYTSMKAKRCPKCRSKDVSFQRFTEEKKSGCLTYLWYILLTFTCFGLFIVLPLGLRNRTKSGTYAICNNCGHTWKVSK